MRLIDADALREVMYHEAFEKDTDMQKWDGGCWIRYKMFENAIESAPTIDPVKEKDFVDEIIGYIFAYPDDDYMTIETLCRKLYKHGLIDKKDGEWICPQTEEEFEEPNYYDPALWE